MGEVFRGQDPFGGQNHGPQRPFEAPGAADIPLPPEAVLGGDDPLSRKGVDELGVDLLEERRRKLSMIGELVEDPPEKLARVVRKGEDGGSFVRVLGGRRPQPLGVGGVQGAVAHEPRRKLREVARRTPPVRDGVGEARA